MVFPLECYQLFPCKLFVNLLLEDELFDTWKKKRVVIFAAGTGNPYFTTDTAAALRAAEMNCSVIMKGTKVDGVYSSDPLNDDNAIKYRKISYSEVLARNLKVMDSSAVSLARDNNIPIIIFSIKETNSFFSAIKGKIDISMITT